MIPRDIHFWFMDPLLSLAIAVTVFFSLLQLVVLVEVLLSWTPLFFGRLIRIEFVSNIVEPLADAVSRVLPARFGMIDLSRLYVMVACEIVIVATRSFVPAVSVYVAF
jgi:YggT family protein